MGGKADIDTNTEILPSFWIKYSAFYSECLCVYFPWVVFSWACSITKGSLHHPALSPGRWVKLWWRKSTDLERGDRSVRSQSLKPPFLYFTLLLHQALTGRHCPLQRISALGTGTLPGPFSKILNAVCSNGAWLEVSNDNLIHALITRQNP